jgi:uncharacterized protein
MVKTTDTKGGLAAIAEAADSAPGRGLPPVHLWNPPHCGEIDIVIRRDGTWLHENSPIGRAALVRLFSTVLRKDPDGYCLVTPVEKLTIRVEDLPFRAVAMTEAGGRLHFTTDVGDVVEAGPDHPLRVETDPVTGEPSPALHVRGDLWARIARPVFYELVERADLEGDRLVARSGEASFDLGAIGAGAA